MRWWALVVVAFAAAAPARGAPPEDKVPPPRHVPITPPAAAGASVSRAAPRAAASRLDTTTFWSQSLGARKRVVTWLPPSYDHAPTRRYPLAIYLHGIWGNETNWTERGAIHHTLDSLVAAGMPEFIVAMPDGDDGWYTTWNVLGDYGGCRRDFQPRNGDTADTYCVPWLHYDDYIARDLVEYLDRAYRTDPRRERRGIAGLSMGGYGAISIALAYPEVFRAAASHSGVLSPLLVGPDPFAPPPAYATTIEQLERAWGDRFWPLIRPAFGPDTTAWWSRDPARRAAQLWSTDRRLVPALMLDIGTEDGLLGQNRAFRHELARLGVPHTYAEWPGKHEWPYWRQHAAESLRFLAGHIAR